MIHLYSNDLKSMKIKMKCKKRITDFICKGLTRRFKTISKNSEKTSIISHETLYILYSVNNICQMILRLQQKARHFTVYAFVN